MVRIVPLFERMTSVSVVARISAPASPLQQSGDLYGEIRYVAGKSGAQALQIDKLNP